MNPTRGDIAPTSRSSRSQSWWRVSVHDVHSGAAAARAAARAGDRRGYEWWLEICRALDRRMASELGAAFTGELG